MAVKIARNPYLKLPPKTDAPLDLRDDMSEFGKGIRAFGDETQALGGGLLALGAQALKSEFGGSPDGILQKAVDTGLETYTRNMAESTAGKQAPAVDRIEEIKGPGSFTDWASYELGRGLPNVAGLGAASLVGRGIAGATVRGGLKHLAKTEVGKSIGGRTVTKEVQDQVRDQIKKRLTAGTVAGGFLGSAGLEGGSAFGQMTQEGISPEDALGPSLAVAGLNGALEFTPLYAVAKSMGAGEFAKRGIREIIKKEPDLAKRAVQLAAEVGRRTAGAGAVGAAVEGTTEGLQELAQIAAMRWAKNEELFAGLDDEDWSQIANAAAAGAVTGGAIAGGVGGFVGPEGVKLDRPEPPPSDRPDDFIFDEAGNPIVPVPPPTRDRPQPRTDGPTIRGRDERVREGEVLSPEPRGPAGPGLNRQGTTVEGEVIRPRIGADPNRLAVDGQPGLTGPKDQIIDGDTAEISPPQIPGPTFPLLPRPVEEPSTGPTTEDLIQDYHRRTTGRFQDGTPQGELDLSFDEFDKTKAGKPYKTQGTADKAARQRGLTNYEVVERDGNWIIRDLGPTREVRPDTPAVAPVPPDQLTVFGQDTKGDVTEIRSPATDETQQRIEAERRGQGSFLTKVGTKKGSPFKSRGAAEAAVRRRGMENALVVEEDGGYVIQTWPDQATQPQDTTPESKTVATPQELGERLEQGERLTQDEVIESFDIPDRRSLLQGLKTAYTAGTLTRAQYDSLRKRVARDELEYVFESLQEMEAEGRDPARAFLPAETVEMEASVDKRQVIALFGANMYKTGFVETIVKELAQNAFDAGKIAARQDKKPRRVDVVLNDTSRSVTVKDTGTGMSTEEVEKFFLRVGGTGKGGVKTSGGKGLAKITYLFGSETVHMMTTKDGITTEIFTNPDELYDKTVKAKRTETPDRPNGTTVTIVVPETVELENGDTRKIAFPYNANSVSFFTKPLLGPVELYWHTGYSPDMSAEDLIAENNYSVQPKDEGGYGVYRLTGSGRMREVADHTTEEEATADANRRSGKLEQGIHFDFEDKGLVALSPMTTAWADIQIYIGRGRKKFPMHSVLSDGLYQFDMALRQPGVYERIPHDIIVNVTPTVSTKSPTYPFTNSREGWSAGVATDVKALVNFLHQYFRGIQGRETTDKFKMMYQLPKIDFNLEADALPRVKLDQFVRPVQQETTTPPVKQPDRYSIADGKLFDTSEKIPKRIDLGEKTQEETLNANKSDIPEIEDVVGKGNYDPNQPLFHNNTTVDYIDKYGQPAAQFFSEIGSVVLDMMEAVGDLKLYNYQGFAKKGNAARAYGGISIDKSYRGVALKVPSRAFFLNPLSVPSYITTVTGLAHSNYLTIVHEIAHNASMEHNETHTLQLHHLYEQFAEQGLHVEFEDKFTDVYYRHRDVFNNMRNDFEQSNTANVTESLHKGKGVEGSELEGSDGGRVGHLNSTEAARLRGQGGRTIRPSVETAAELEGEPRRVPRDSVEDELFSHAKVHAPKTATQLREELTKFLGAAMVKRLEDSGLLRIHDRAHDKGASGTFNLRQGVVNLWAGSMARGTTGIGVLLHEGSHAGLDTMLGGRLSSFIDDIFAQARQGNKIAEQAIRQAIPAAILEREGLTSAKLIEDVKQSFVHREEVVAYYIQLAQDAQVENGVTRRLRDQLKVAFARSPFGRAAKAMGMGFELTPEMATEYARAALNDTLLAAEELVAMGAPDVQSSVPGSLNLESRVEVALTALDLVPGAEYVEWKNTGKLGNRTVVLPSQIQMKSNIDRDEVTKAKHLADGLPKELADINVRFSSLGGGWGARREGTIYLDTGIGNRTAGLLKPTLLREMDRALEDQRGWTGFEPSPSMGSLSALARVRVDAHTLLPSAQPRAMEILREVERIQSDPILAPVVDGLIQAVERGDEAAAFHLMERMRESIDPRLLEEMGLEVPQERPEGRVPFTETHLLAELFSSDRAVRDDLIRLGELRSGGDIQPFNTWIEGSLVVSEDGTPKTLFHTRTQPGPLHEDFAAGLGIFLTESEAAASDTFRLNAQIRNPLTLKDEEAQRVVDDTAHQVQVIHRAKRDGHDGIVLENVIENAEEQQLGTNYIIFKPRQLRQADGTRRFEANSPEELYSIASEFLEVYNEFQKGKRRTLARASEEAGFTVQNLRDASDILNEDLSWLGLLEREVKEKEDIFIRGFPVDLEQPLDLQAERQNILDNREIDRRREAFKQTPLLNIKSMEEFIARMETIGIPEFEYDSDTTQVLLIEGIPVSLELQWNGQTMEIAFQATEAKLLDHYGYAELLEFQNPVAAMRRITKELVKLAQQRLKDVKEGAVVVFTGTNDARQRIYEKLFTRLGVKLEDIDGIFTSVKAMRYQPDLELEPNLGGDAVDNLFEATYARVDKKLRSLGKQGEAVADDMQAFEQLSPEEQQQSLLKDLRTAQRNSGQSPLNVVDDELYSFADTLSGVRRWAWTDPSDPPDTTKLGAFQRWYTDYVDNLSTIEKKSKSVWDRFDLAKSRRGAKLDEINRRFFHPLKEAIAKTGLTLDEVNDWIAARHIYLDDVNKNLSERASYRFARDLAKHLPKGKRKELVAKIKQLRTGRTEIGVQLTDKEVRKRMAALVDEYSVFEVPSVDLRIGGNQRAKVTYEWNHFKQHASGMFVEGDGLSNTLDAPNAKEIYEQYASNRELLEVAEIFDKLTRHQLDLLVEGGTLTIPERDALLADKQHYAPLRREAFDYETGMDFLGQAGLGPSKGVRFRGGSVDVDRPVHVVQNALARAHAAASHAQKNLANNYLYEAIQQNRPEWDDWFSIDEQNVSVTMDSMGFLTEQQSMSTRETDLVVIRDGKRLLIRPREQNERAVRFAAAVNKLEAQAHGGAFKVFGWVNTIVRFTAVSASPAFLMTNLIRDPLTAVYNMQASEAGEHTKAIVKDYRNSFRTLWNVYMKGVRDPANPDVQWVERFEKAGGRISFVQSLRDMDNTWGSFRTHLYAAKTPGVKQVAQTFKMIEDANIAVENIMRFATFKQLADVVGDAKAARIAKDLTTNFDRRGFRTQTMGLLYLFFNATVQGNVQVIKNLAQSRKLMAMVGGTFVIAGLMDMMGRALSDEDDDGKKEWDKIPLYEKERNIVLPFKIGGEYVKIPAPWVYNVVWRTGGMLSEFAAGARSGGDVGVDMASMALTTFNPMGGGSFAQALSPTALDPLIQVIENKDFAGNTMRPTNFPGAGSKADAHLAWAATPNGYKWIAQTLNELTGGDVANSGWIDVHPSTVQNTVNFLGGGLVRFASNLMQMPRTLAAEELEVRKVPIIRQFAARPTSQIDTQLYHERVAQVLKAEKAVKEYGRGETRDPERQARAKERYAKELALVSFTKDMERQLRSLRQRRRAALGRKDEARAKVLKERIEERQRDFNKMFEKRLGL